MAPNLSAALDSFVVGGDLLVNRIGYGAMRLTGQPGNFGPYADWEEGQKLLRRAVALGVNFIDTAEAYGPGFNEELIASALYPYPPGLVIATKGGIAKPSPNDIRADGKPESLRRSCEASLRRLQREQIDLYQLHRPDPTVPFLDSIEMLTTLQQEGKIRHIGLSNITIAQLEEARSLVPIASVQNRYGITERSNEAMLLRIYSEIAGGTHDDLNGLVNDCYSTGFGGIRSDFVSCVIKAQRKLLGERKALRWT